MSHRLFTDPVFALRWVGRLEAVSFLLLLLVAMPLKYAAGDPRAVEVVGMAHGVLFLGFGVVWMVSVPRLPRRWAVAALAASVVPGGPFWIDPRLKPFERRRPSGTA